MFTYQTYIDGKWVDAASGKTFQTFDPYTGEPWATVPECDKVDVDRAVEAASRAFEAGPWPKMTPTERGKIMRRIAQLIEKHSEHLGQIEVRDNGKLISEMAAQTKYMPEWFYYYGGLADKVQGAVVPVDRPENFTYILREPVGVCAFITPWNSPLMLATWKMAPALAAGCTMVIKPSEFTSASLLEFMKLVIEESGLPPGVVNIVTGYGAVTGEPLVTHPKVAKVAFTGGSASTSWPPRPSRKCRWSSVANRPTSCSTTAFWTMQSAARCRASSRRRARPASLARVCCCRRAFTTSSLRSWWPWPRRPASAIPRWPRRR